MSPLALAGDQLEVVLAHAATVPRCWRGRWLDLLSDQLIGRAITDEAVRDAINAVDRMISR